MTFSQVDELYEYWRNSPLAHELLAARYGFQPQLTAEEMQQQGAMGPDELLGHQAVTGGKIEGLGPV